MTSHVAALAFLVLLMTASSHGFTTIERSAFLHLGAPINVQGVEITLNKQTNGVKRLLPIVMGRAAAVRAATKGKTDAKKAKTNAVYGKKIIMAVKSGGSPNPDANATLKDLITKAKANSVPVDVSSGKG
jgi:hypothetical protein